jgi:hypothetical protein
LKGVSHSNQSTEKKKRAMNISCLVPHHYILFKKKFNCVKKAHTHNRHSYKKEEDNNGAYMSSISPLSIFHFLLQCIQPLSSCFITHIYQYFLFFALVYLKVSDLFIFSLVTFFYALSSSYSPFDHLHMSCTRNFTNFKFRCT